MRRETRCFRWAVVGLIAVGSAAFVPAEEHGQVPAPAGPAIQAIPPREPAAPRPGGTKPEERIREGTRLVEVSGTFGRMGDRITFQPTGQEDSLLVLENLALQRVGRVLNEDRQSLPWVVSGVVTEYQDANYLLLTKAVAQMPKN